MIEPFHSIANVIKSHYNNTNTYGMYNLETQQHEVFTYTEPIKDIVITDVITVGLLYYVLTNL